MKLRILQVEDDPDILEISRVALELVGGHEVFQFAEGREAIRNAAEIAPDVILLDVMMPGMTGEETLAQLRAISPTTAVLLSSGYSQSTLPQRLKELGATGFIAKPYTSDQLHLAIRQYLQNSPA